MKYRHTLHFETPEHARAAYRKIEVQKKYIEGEIVLFETPHRFSVRENAAFLEILAPLGYTFNVELKSTMAELHALYKFNIATLDVQAGLGGTGTVQAMIDGHAVQKCYAERVLNALNVRLGCGHSLHTVDVKVGEI